MFSKPCGKNSDGSDLNMPTVEIVSLGCIRIPKIPRYQTFGWRAEKVLKSHRNLFQSLFDEQKGVIFHLGNKDMEKSPEGCWFAGKVMDWTEGKTVFFPRKTFTEFKDLLTRLIESSPEKRIIFATDYQFGGKRSIWGELRVSTFLKLHKARKIKYNTLIYIRKDA
jgi:hypothetical protein